MLTTVKTVTHGDLMICQASDKCLLSFSHNLVINSFAADMSHTALWFIICKHSGVTVPHLEQLSTHTCNKSAWIN